MHHTHTLCTAHCVSALSVLVCKVYQTVITYLVRHGGARIIYLGFDLRHLNYCTHLPLIIHLIDLWRVTIHNIIIEPHQDISVLLNRPCFQTFSTGVEHHYTCAVIRAVLWSDGALGTL